MKVKLSFVLAVMCFTLFQLTGCKKDEATIININIISPVNNSTYNFGDTVLFRVDVSSDKNIESISIQLKDLNGTPLATVVTLSPNAKTYSLTELYPLNAPTLSGENYYFDVIVSNGNRTDHSPVYFNLFVRPLQTRAVYFIEKTTLNLNVHQLDSLGMRLLTTIPGDFSGAGIYETSRLLITSGRQTGGINWIDLANNGAIVRTLPPYNSASGPSFTYGSLQDNLFYVSRYDGSIKGYNYLGNKMYDTGENPYFIPGNTLFIGSQLLAEVTYIPSQERKLMSFFYPSGFANLVHPVDFIPEKWLSVSADSSLVFGTKSGNTLAYYYILSADSYNEIKNFGNQGAIYDVIRLSSGKILLATSTGGLIEYNLANNSAFTVYNQTITDLEINSVTGEIYCASGRNSFSLNSNYLPFDQRQFTDSLVAIKAEYFR